jgi:hypothetical protein
MNAMMNTAAGQPIARARSSSQGADSQMLRPAQAPAAASAIANFS